jgi:mannose-6-phosphate isomerase-like protein (cupin superfamily)
MSTHESVIVRKPWGFEYMAYQNEHVALWVLHIKKGHKTSLHCHPKKTTGLVVVSGTVNINFISDSREITAPGKQMIRRGLFHQTCALTEDVIVLEIETPVDKNDLVRLNDCYGRENSGYENSEFELPKSGECLWFDDTPSIFTMFGRTFNVEKATLNVIESKIDTDIIVFLQGSLLKNIDCKTQEVIIPGDVGFARVVKVVASQMNGFSDDAVILTLS